MRFLISVIDDKTTHAPADEMAAIDAFNDKLQATGHWIFACGIDDPAKATVIDNRLGANQALPGPLFDQNEHFSGFWIIQAEDLNVAESLALEGSRACNRKVELRPILF